MTIISTNLNGKRIVADWQAKPILEMFEGVMVVRDDLFPGGTKARFLRPFLEALPQEEFIYASPAQGGAQTALATAAVTLGKKITIFVAKRKEPHPRAKLARKLGAKIVQVPHGYLNVVQAAAKKYAAKSDKRLLLPFGMDSPEAVAAIANVASLIRPDFEPEEVWCAAGSGTLARGLRAAFPEAKLRVVQVGRTLKAAEVGGKGTKIYVYNRPYDKHARIIPPFPSDPHYDAKAWEVCLAKKGKGKVLIWNVTGPA